MDLEPPVRLVPTRMEERAGSEDRREPVLLVEELGVVDYEVVFVERVAVVLSSRFGQDPIDGKPEVRRLVLDDPMFEQV